jgi:hypothetical protein
VRRDMDSIGSRDNIDQSTFNVECSQIHEIPSVALAFSDVSENGTDVVTEPLGVSPAYSVNFVHDRVCFHVRCPSSKACGVHNTGIL